MDGTTEPLIVVMGHPIAGNPSQFVLESAFRSLGLDWRVFSVDVAPEHVATALDGFRVTGIRGIYIDPTVQPEAATWCRTQLHPWQPKANLDAQTVEPIQTETPSDTAAAVNSVTDDPSVIGPVALGQESTQNDADKDELIDREMPSPSISDRSSMPASLTPLPYDCLSRNEDGGFDASYQQRQWMQRWLREPSTKRLWFGPVIKQFQLSAQVTDQILGTMPDPEQIVSAELIVLTEDADSDALDIEDWPRCDSRVTVLDYSGHPDIGLALQQRGYRVLSDQDYRIGALQGCIERWTGRSVSSEVLQDAIEEYLSV